MEYYTDCIPIAHVQAELSTRAADGWRLVHCELTDIPQTNKPPIRCAFVVMERAGQRPKQSAPNAGMAMK